MEYNTENHRQFSSFSRNELNPNDGEIVIDNSSAKERRRIFSESRQCKKVYRSRSQSSTSSDSSSENGTPVKGLKKNLEFYCCFACCTKSNKNKEHKKEKKTSNKRIFFAEDTEPVTRKSKFSDTQTSSQNIDKNVEGINFDDLILNEREDKKDIEKKGKLTEGIPVKGKKNLLNLESKQGRQKRSHSQDSKSSKSLKSLVPKKTRYRHRNLEKYGRVYFFNQENERKTCHQYEVRSTWDNIKSNSGEIYINKKKSGKDEHGECSSTLV